jgi:hypothetical protein
VIHDFDVLLARAEEERDRAAGRPRLADRGLALDLLRTDLAKRRLALYEALRESSGAVFERDLRRLAFDPLHA